MASVIVIEKFHHKVLSAQLLKVLCNLQCIQFPNVLVERLKLTTLTTTWLPGPCWEARKANSECWRHENLWTADKQKGHTEGQHVVTPYSQISIKIGDGGPV